MKNFTLEGLINFKNKSEYLEEKYITEGIYSIYRVTDSVKTITIKSENMFQYDFNKLIIKNYDENLKKIEFSIKHYNNNYYTECSFFINNNCLTGLDLNHVKVKMKNIAWKEYERILKINNIIKNIKQSSRKQYEDYIEAWNNNPNWDIWGTFGVEDTFEMYEPEIKYLQNELESEIENDRKKEEKDILVFITLNEDAVAECIEMKVIDFRKFYKELLEGIREEKSIIINNQLRTLVNFNRLYIKDKDMKDLILKDYIL